MAVYLKCLKANVSEHYMNDTFESMSRNVYGMNYMGARIMTIRKCLTSSLDLVLRCFFQTFYIFAALFLCYLWICLKVWVNCGSAGTCRVGTQEQN